MGTKLSKDGFKFELLLITILVFMGCQSSYRIKKICKNSINSSISDFENSLKDKKLKVDSFKYVKDYPLQICGKEYFLEGKYYIRAYFSKSKCFPSTDTFRLDNVLNYSISKIIIQKRSEDVQIFD
jgi:hypothetical protein